MVGSAITRHLALLVTVLAITQAHVASAQDQRRIDSLINALPLMKSDTDQVKCYRAIIWQSTFYGDHTIALRYGPPALALARRSGNERITAHLLMAIGRSHWKAGQFDTALKTDLEALALFEKLGAKEMVAEQLRFIAQDHIDDGRSNEAVPILRRAMALYEELGAKRGVAGAHQLLGYIHEQQGDPAAQINECLAAMKIYEELQDSLGMASTLTGLAAVYAALGKPKEALDQLNRAVGLLGPGGRQSIDNLAYANVDIGDIHASMGDRDAAESAYGTALAIGQQLNNNSILGRANDGLGRLHLRQGEYGPALSQLLLAAGHFESSGFSSTNAARIYSDISTCHTRLGHYAEAQRYLDRVKVLGHETGSRTVMASYHRGMEILDSTQGDWLNAYRQNKSYIAYRDSSLNDDNRDQVARSQVRYDYDKKMLADSLSFAAVEAVQAKEIQKQKVMRNAFITGFALVLLFAVVFFFQRNRIKKEKLLSDELRERAELSEKAKERFLANMSHEIRTPMNAIMGMSEILKTRPHAPEQEKYLSAIAQSSENLLVIINDILDLTKIEAGRIDFEAVPFEPRTVLGNVRDILQFKAEEKGLALVLDIAPEVPDWLIGDPTRLNQIVMNLGGNAIKFTEQGSVTVRAKATADTAGRGDRCLLIIDVIDTGVGIPEDRLERIFEEFTQAYSDTTRKYGGTGLGLTISRRLAQKQGGSVTVRSERDKGSTFTVSIPYAVGAA